MSPLKHFYEKEIGELGACLLSKIIFSFHFLKFVYFKLLIRKWKTCVMDNYDKEKMKGKLGNVFLGRIVYFCGCMFSKIIKGILRGILDLYSHVY